MSKLQSIEQMLREETRLVVSGKIPQLELPPLPGSVIMTTHFLVAPKTGIYSVQGLSDFQNTVYDGKLFDGGLMARYIQDNNFEPPLEAVYFGQSFSREKIGERFESIMVPEGSGPIEGWGVIGSDKGKMHHARWNGEVWEEVRVHFLPDVTFANGYVWKFHGSDFEQLKRTCSVVLQKDYGPQPAHQFRELGFHKEGQR